MPTSPGAATRWGWATSTCPRCSASAGLAHPPLFAPAVIPAHRGMVVEVPLPLAAMAAARQRPTALRDCLARFLRRQPRSCAWVLRPPTASCCCGDRRAPSDGMELHVFAAARREPGAAGRGARQPRQGRERRGGAEPQPDGRARRDRGPAALTARKLGSCLPEHAAQHLRGFARKLRVHRPLDLCRILRFRPFNRRSRCPTPRPQALGTILEP